MVLILSWRASSGELSWELLKASGTIIQFLSSSAILSLNTARFAPLYQEGPRTPEEQSVVATVGGQLHIYLIRLVSVANTTSASRG